jgi:regulator of protease activity HflC (stomatin/prohibitin superfamily)
LTGCWTSYWIIVSPYERVIVLTLGKVRRKQPVLGPGIHPICPLGIEEVLEDNIVPASLADLTIDMTLKDGTPLHVEFSALWQITDMLKFKLEIEDADSVLLNVQGMVQEYLFQFKWDELITLRSEGVGDKRQGLPWKLKTHCNQEVRKWGAELVEFYIQSFIRPELRTGVVKTL